MKLLIWDLPTRLFHWLFAGSVILAFGFAQLSEKESPTFYLHVIFGVLGGVLLGWRLVWGFWGSRHSRWKALLFTPSSIVQYFQSVFIGRGQYFAGHNPGSSLVIIALLIGVAMTLLSGILIPQSEIFEELHESLPIVVMVLVAVHVAGVLLASRVHNINYIRAMVDGRRQAQLEDGIDGSRPIAGIFMLALVLGVWLYFIRGFDRNSAVFTAPGTAWSFQVGEPEAGEGSGSSKGKPSGKIASDLEEAEGDDD
jgi:cytochrome b